MFQLSFGFINSYENLMQSSRISYIFLAPLSEMNSPKKLREVFRKGGALKNFG